MQIKESHTNSKCAQGEPHDAMSVYREKRLNSHKGQGRIP